MTKKALLLCSSHNDLGLVKALRKLGYYIIVTGNKSGLIGQRWCDEFIKADYSDKELILSIARSNEINAICQCCNDLGVYTAAYVAEQMGLPGYDSYETTLLLHNKDRFKEYAKRHNITSPMSMAFSNEENALEYAETADYPIIIKPTDCSAGNGISKVNNKESALSAIKYAFNKSRVGRIVIERYVMGTQHGFCTFLIDQKVVAICSNNEYSILNPFRVEIDTYPADNYEIVKDALIQQIELIAKDLKLKDGIFHLQYIFDGRYPQIIEVMRRILGNMYHVPGNMLTGIDWEYWETRARCGLPLDDFPSKVSQEGYYAYKAIMAEKEGIFYGINIPKEYAPYLYDTYLIREKGYQVDDFKSDPMGFMFFMFDNFTNMKDVLLNNYSNKIAIIK